MASSPEQWKDPGIVFSVCRDAQVHDQPNSTEDSYTLMAGPRYRIAKWEQRWLAPQTENPALGWDQSHVGDPKLIENFRDAGPLGFSFELDISWDDQPDKVAALRFMDQVLPRRLVSLLRSLPPLTQDDVNSNRTHEMDPQFADLHPAVIDLPINTLPSSRRRSRPYVCATRWVRLVVTKYGFIALWHPIDSDTWPAESVPWPHNAVPSRERHHLMQLCAPIAPQKRLGNWLADLVRHEEYFLKTWETEIEFWQASAFEWLRGALKSSDVDKLRDDLSLLSGYLTNVRWTQRAILRKSSETEPLTTHYKATSILGEAAVRIRDGLSDSRRTLNDCFAILTTVSQRVQEEAAQEAKESSENLNKLITLLTAILFAPTIVFGIYGSSIIELSEGSKSTFSDLVFYLVGSVVASIGIFYTFNRKPRRGASVLVLGTFSMVAYLFFSASGLPRFGLFIGGSMILACFAIAIAAHINDRRSHE